MPNPNPIPNPNQAHLEAKSKEQQKIGLNVAFTAYECLLESRSSQAFERQLYYDSLKGVPVGQINHSDAFFFAFRDAIFQELQHRLKTYLEKPQPCLGGHCVPFCVVADKMTALRRTNQMVGILLIDYSTGCIVPMLAGTRLVTDGSGSGTAKNIMDVLTEECKLQPGHLKVQVAGQGYDGAYHHCNVPQELATKLGHPSMELTLPG